VRPCLKKHPSQKRADGVAQSVCPEFKSHYCKKNMDNRSKHFSKENIRMHNKSMKKYSRSLTIRKMQMKPTISYCLNPVKMTDTKKAKDYKKG
jgi:hypothetical protein